MKAVSEVLLDTIKELQNLPSLSGCSLGGGTNLAIRYNHRTSLDIDLFFPGIIGKTGYETIKAEIIELYGDRVTGFDYPCDEDDQFLFLRFFVKKKDATVKVEILQNMQNHETPEMTEDIRLMTERDISVLKLMTACNRANQKDIFDLDYLTDNIPLEKLMGFLSEKQSMYSKPEHRTIFDLDDEKSPLDDPALLLKFETPVKGSASRPGHSNPRIDAMAGEKNWLSARSSWRRKVRAYFKSIDKDFPSAASYG